MLRCLALNLVALLQLRLQSSFWSDILFRVVNWMNLTWVSVSPRAVEILALWLTSIYWQSAKHRLRWHSCSDVKLVLALLANITEPPRSAARRLVSRGSALTVLATVDWCRPSHTSTAAKTSFKRAVVVLLFYSSRRSRKILLNCMILDQFIKNHKPTTDYLLEITLFPTTGLPAPFEKTCNF